MTTSLKFISKSILHCPIESYDEVTQTKPLKILSFGDWPSYLIGTNVKLSIVIPIIVICNTCQEVSDHLTNSLSIANNLSTREETLLDATNLIQIFKHIIAVWLCTYIPVDRVLSKYIVDD